jgi:hypothetical protein
MAKEKKPSFSSHILVHLYYGGFEKTKAAVFY